MSRLVTMSALIAALALAALYAVGAAEEDSAAAEAPSLAALPLEPVGTPLRTMRRSGDFLIPKPEGAGWWFLTSYNPMHRNPMSNQVFVVDLDARTSRVVWGPPAGGLAYGWHNKGLRGPDGLHYLCQHGRMGLYAFDPATGSLEWIDCPDIQDRVSPFQMRLTPDGKIFMGTASGSAYLVAFDIRTRRFRNYGVPGPPRPRPMYVWSMAVSDEYVYCGMGKNPWTLVATRRDTGEHTVLLPELDMEYLTVIGAGESCLAQVKLRPDPDSPAAAQRLYRLTEGRAQPCESAPSTPTAAETESNPMPELMLTLARPTSAGKAEVWFRMPGGDWQSVALAGIQTTPWRFVCLKRLPDGRLFGAPAGYEDVFFYDPAADRFDYPGKSTMSIDRIECMHGKLYLLGYPGTIVHEYDPGRPWTFHTTTPTAKEPELTAPESNPRFCARLGEFAQTHHVHGSAIGDDGCIYVGAHAERLHVGGGLCWWDPATGKGGGIREPFLVQDCDDLCAARGGELIVYAGRRVSDPGGKQPTPSETKLYILDVKTRTLTSALTPLPGMTRCGHIAGRGNRIYGIGRVGDRHHFYVVDLAEQRTIHAQPVAAGSGRIVGGPDGRFYTFVGETLMRIDPATFALQPLGVAAGAGPLEFVGHDLYIGQGAILSRLGGVTAMQ